MASFRKRGAKWEVRWVDADGQQHSKGGFATKVDAGRYGVEQEAKVARGDFVDPRAGRILFGDYGDAWLARQVHHRRTTAEQVGSYYRNHIGPAFERRPLSSVKPSEIQAFVEALSEKLAPSTSRSSTAACR